MTLTKRIIPCLDVKNGRVVKGLNFESIKDAGDPVELAAKYSNEGADELVFIDITKELPATLILRPFNFETLSTRIYRFASDERLAEASQESLIIIALGLILTVILVSNAKKAKK